MRRKQRKALERELEGHFKGGHYLEIVFDSNADNDEHSGFIVGLSAKFIALQTILEWHVDGIQVIPIERIESCVRDDTRMGREKILAWRGVKRTGQYEWIDLSGFTELFSSLKKNTRTIAIEDNEIAEIGELLEVKDDRVLLRGIDTCGSWIDDPIEFCFKNMLKVTLDAEYGSVLREFADSNS